MRAVFATRFGDPTVLEAREAERPKPGIGQVLVKIVASGTNPVDAKLRTNGAWAGLKPPVILGYDVAGIVEELGPGVTDFKPGDEVYYSPDYRGGAAGSYAEYHVADVRIVAPKPRNLSFVEAAAVPLAGGTAWEGVVRRLAVHVGETILIHGGAGGVGSFAVQIARAAGAWVLATAGPENQQTLRDLGASLAIDYHQADPAEVALRETSGKGVDAVFDAVGGELISKSLRATRRFGRMATVLAPTGDLTQFFSRNLTLYGISLTRERPRLEEMTRLIERGQMRPLVEEVLPLEEVRKAHLRLDSGHGRGKIVLQVAKT